MEERKKEKEMIEIYIYIQHKRKTILGTLEKRARGEKEGITRKLKGSREGRGCRRDEK